jgi:uncharacterized integral membrane protein
LERVVFELVSKSLKIFGWIGLVGGLMAGLILDGLYIDVVAFIVICYASGVAARERRAVKWSLGCMGYYLVIAVTLSIVALTNTEELKIGKFRAEPDDLPMLLIFFGIVAAWAGTNFVLLWQLLKQTESSTLSGSTNT